MDLNEFSVACKLINLKLKGFELPATLPPSILVVPQMPAVSGVMTTSIVPPMGMHGEFNPHEVEVGEVNPLMVVCAWNRWLCEFDLTTASLYS